MMIKNILFTTLIISCAAIAMAQDDMLDTFSREIADNAGNISSIHCSFVQTRSLSVLIDESKKTGTFYLVMPDKILLSFDDGDMIKITGKRFELRNAGHVTISFSSSSPVTQGIQTIITACITGNLNNLSKDFFIEPVASESSWSVSIVPRRDKATALISRITLVIDRKDMSLSSMTMEEPSGNLTTYNFFNKKFNTAIDAEIFD